MICAFDKEKLTGFLDGELEAAEKSEVERHIASCSECLRELGELKSAAQMVRELPRLRAPLSVAAGVARESSAAGRARSLKRIRNSLLWAAGAAAALLVVLNILYFRRLSPEPAGVPVSSAANTLARAELRRAPADEPAPASEQAKSEPLSVAPQKPAPAAARKSPGAPAASADKAGEREALARANPEERDANRARRESDALKGAAAVTPKPTAAPGAPAASPPPPAAPPAALAESQGKAAEKSADAQPSRALGSAKDADAGQEAPKPKKASPGETAAGSAPTHLTLASTQLARSRGHLDEELRKLGVSLPGPAGGGRGQRSPSREDATLTVELTDSQIARLRRELEKPGSCTVLAGRPEDTLVPGLFERGGLFGAAKREAAPSAEAPAPRKPQEPARNDPKGDERDRDAKQLEEQAAPVAAPAAADHPTEAKRKVVLHLIEVASLPEAVRPVDPVKK